MEAEKILHLRKYVTLLHTGIKSRVAHTHLHTYSTACSPCRGYALRYVPQQSVRAYLRPENYVATYSKMFSTTLAQISVDDIEQRLMLLCSDVKKGQVSADDLREIIKLCDNQTCHSVLLLKCCGNLSFDLDASERQKLIDEVWSLAEKSSKGITLDHYNTLLQVQIDFNSMNPMEFLTNMTVEPNENTYSLLLNGVAKAGNNKCVWDIISVMKKKNIVFDENMFNTLVQIYANNGNIDEAERLITFMRDTKLSVTKAYTELAYGCAKFNDVQKLIKILNDEPQSDMNLLGIIKILSVSNNWFIPIVLNFLSHPLSTDQISKTIVELVHAKEVVGAITIINYFKLNNATKDIARSFVNSFLNELIMIKAPVTNIVKHATNFMDCEPLALSNVAEIALKLDRQDLCDKIFHAMRDKGMKIRPHYYWPILAMAHRNKGEVEVFSILQSMINENIEVDFDTLLYHVYPYINTANPHVTLQRMRIHMPDSIVFSPLVAFLLFNNRLQDAINLCERANRKIYYKKLMKPMIHAYFNTRDGQSCVKLLTMYPYSQSFVSMFLKMMLNDKLLNLHIEDLQLTLIEFMKHNVKIMRRDANYLRNKIEKHLDTENSTMILNLIEDLVDDQFKNSKAFFDISYMDSEDLECFFVEQKNKNYSVKYILRKLFEIYCDENKLEKAEMVKHELDACGYEWTYGMKMHLFELYVKRDKLDYAKIILSEINNTEFKIDSMKILAYATALVKANKPTEAFRVIKETKNIKTDNNVQNLCYDLLDTLACSQYCDQTKNMLKLLIERNYSVVSPEMLRPLIMISLKRNDISQTMKTFIECATKYKKTPLALEILTVLLQRRDDLNLADIYIDQIYKLIIDVRDINVANTIFAIALATLNKTKELQDILQKHKISTNTLIWYGNYLQKLAKTDSLLRIFEALPNTNSLHQIILCDLLINIYSKTSNYNGALDLWNKMHAKNIKFSKQSEQVFIQLLLLNKVPLPLDMDINNELY